MKQLQWENLIWNFVLLFTAITMIFKTGHWQWILILLFYAVSKCNGDKK